ncbi:hypothetical protein [Leucobacter chromiireducens]|uniref:hypothetical protein n=1 Tax=Leucobacter chromiireducens TaxID=283877 RepID=UPI003F7E7916
MTQLTYLILTLIGNRTPRMRELIPILDIEGPFALDEPDLPSVLTHLTSLLNEGLIGSDSDGGAEYPDAQHLHVTNAGEQLLRDWIDEPYSPIPRVDEVSFSLRILAAATFAPYSALRLLETEITYRRSQLELLTALPADGAPPVPVMPGSLAASEVGADSPGFAAVAMEPGEDGTLAPSQALSRIMRSSRVTSIQNWVEALTEMHLHLIHGSSQSLLQGAQAATAP